MKVGLISTHPPLQCGIATYTRKLSAALASPERGVSVAILAEQGGEAALAEIPCEACFSRRGDFGPPIEEAAVRLGIDVAHFQHAPDIFGVDGRMPRAAQRLRRRGIRVIVTLHTVFTRASGLLERRPFVASFHRGLGRVVDGIVVHSDTSRAILEGHGVSAGRIEVIPHGTDDPVRGDPDAGRKILGVQADDPVLLFYGFVHMQKNIHVLLKALTRVVKSVPNVRLAIVGKPGGDTWYNRLYARWLRRKAERFGLEPNVAIVDRYVDDSEAIDIHAAALAALLPHVQGYGSASGVVHNAMSMGLLPICSDSIKFEEVAASISPELQVPPHDARAWADKILLLLGDGDWRRRIASRVEAYARETRWSEVAAQHIALYRRNAEIGAAAAGGGR